MALLNRKTKDSEPAPAQILAHSEPTPTPDKPVFETVADVDKLISDLEAEQTRLTTRIAELEQAIADAWGLDTSDLEAEYNAVTVRLKASGQVRQRLDDRRFIAEGREIVAGHRARVEALAADVDELQRFEASDEWKEIERRYLEGMEKRRTLRFRISAQQRAFREPIYDLSASGNTAQVQATASERAAIEAEYSAAIQTAFYQL